MTAPLLAYYGDDLTGSTDVMEALELRGVSAVLFTAIPDAALLDRFSDRKAWGIAGTSRSETPEWMDATLPSIFGWLKASGAQICHYKICSTFDSSPTIGSIGRAIDIGAAIFGQPATPVVVGAPQLKRWTAFGNLFADFRGERYRIDRHPVMSRHPVTPMDEADLRLHLGRQTGKSIGLIDCVTLAASPDDEDVDAAFARHQIVILDVLDGATQAETGRQLWRRRLQAPLVVGSSGVEYALCATEAATPLSGGSRTFLPPGGTGPIAVVSGSCSPTTSRQIRNALQNGFEGMALDAALLSVDGSERNAAIDAAVETGLRTLAQGRCPLLYTALEGETPLSDAIGGHLLGRALGAILRGLIDRGGLHRAVVAGGDTSSHAISELGIAALECRMPIPGAPGSPLCLAHRHAAKEQAFEIAFKGGQVGGDDYLTLLQRL